MRKKILSLIDKKGNLPVFPDILVRLQKVMDDPYAGMNDIARIIELDPALAGRILHVSNSAFYHTGYDRIDSLPTALNRLGMEKIRQLVFSIELTKLFSDSRLINPVQFWKHSLAVANFTRLLSRYAADMDPALENTAYLSGLMHDVGIMVMAYLIPAEYARFLENLSQEEIPLEKQEERAFGIDHPEAGARYIEKWWHLDAKIVNSVRYHHLPFMGSENDRRCEQLVHLANGICTSHGQSNGIACYNPVFNPGAWEAMDLSLADAEKMMEDVDVAVHRAMELIGQKQSGNSTG
ncbi:MAG: HDOD domain-containing protein [Desulfobacteraceae bacterium]